MTNYDIASRPMAAIMQFKSHIEGKNADVTIYPDRVEWSKIGSISRKQLGSEVIPVKSISSVTTKKDGFSATKVTVICSGNTIDFRLAHGTAASVKQILTSLILGNHPSQAAAPAAAPPPPSMTPPPSVPAGWNPDPHGRHELRYWDGAGWTEHVSDGGAQSVDPA